MRPLGLTDLEDEIRHLRAGGVVEACAIAERLSISVPKATNALQDLERKLVNPWYFLTPDTSDALAQILSPETSAQWREAGRTESGLIDALAQDSSLAFEILTVLPAMNEVRLSQVSRAIAHYGRPEAHRASEIEWLINALDGHSTASILAAVRERDRRRAAART